MKLFDRQGRTLLLAAVMGGTALVSGAFAQTGEASVPFLVNVNATVSATDGATSKQISVTANQEAILRLPIQTANGVLNGARIQANVPAVISNRNGKVSVNLPAQSYRNAEVSLHTVNGKRISRYNASAANAVNNISHPNLATGVYLLSVKGNDGGAITSRLTHSGGGLNINVAFGSEDLKRLAKEAAAGDWRITVSAAVAGYVDTVYTLRPAAGTNARQNITLRRSGGSIQYESVTIGGKRWMKKDLDIETPSGSWAWCGDTGEYVGEGGICGRFYTWATARTICPAGWHLPTRAEWDHLAESVGGKKSSDFEKNHKWLDAGGFLKSKSAWCQSAGNGSDKFGFAALPGGINFVDEVVDYGKTVSGGCISSGYGAYKSGNDNNYWWTATDSDTTGSAAYSRRVTGSYSYSYDNNDLYENYHNKRTGLSVRCVEGNDNEVCNTCGKYAVTVSSVGTGASGSGSYYAGETVKIYAGTAPSGQVFKEWVVTSDGFQLSVGAKEAYTKISMPAKAVALTAVFEDIAKYTVTVSSAGTGASGGGSYAAGVTVTITAGTDPSGARFKNWETESGVTFAKDYKATTTFTMPAKAVTVTALFEDAPWQITDRRNGNVYKIVKIGNQTWTAENMRGCNNMMSNCVYGNKGLYDKSDASRTCPAAGWRLPRTSEWYDLIEFTGGVGVSGTGQLKSAPAAAKLKSTSGWDDDGNGTDDFGFSALPAGYADFRAATQLQGQGKSGTWWMKPDDINGWLNIAVMKSENNLVQIGMSGGNQAYSVRCIEDND